MEERARGADACRVKLVICTAVAWAVVIAALVVALDATVGTALR